ncbi:MAG: c-type cytochrome domain-containing protein [Zavarzinella sp.]
MNHFYQMKSGIFIAALAACLTMGSSLVAQPKGPNPEILKRLFETANKNDDKFLDKDEFKSAIDNMPKLKDNPRAGDFIFNFLDKDKDGKLNVEEFQALGNLPQRKGPNGFPPPKKNNPEPKKDPEPATNLGKPASAEQIAFFEKKIRPILVDNCYSCHAEEKQKGGLRVDTRDGLLKGGDSGPALIPVMRIVAC